MNGSLRAPAAGTADDSCRGRVTLGEESALRYDAVTKSYRTLLRNRTPALRDFSLSIQRGKVTGLLGPNGAGKTTAMRIAAGLIPRYEGSCTVLGATGPQQLAAVIDRVGLMIETPRFYPRFTAAGCQSPT